jgi:hypothetical protein
VLGVNLDPAVGDIDAGSRSLPLAIAPRRVGDVVDVALRVNTGGASLGAAGFDVHYDPTRLTFLSVAEGSGWGSGTFEANEEVVGTIRFGLAPSVTSVVSGSAVELAVVRFRAVATGTAALSGTVVTLQSLATATQFNGVAIGAGSLPRSMAAADVSVVINAARSRRDVARPEEEAASVVDEAVDAEVVDVEVVDEITDSEITTTTTNNNNRPLVASLQKASEQQAKSR